MACIPLPIEPIVGARGSDVENLNIAVTVADALRHRKQRNGPMLVTAVENEAFAEQVDVALDNAAHKSGLRYRRLSMLSLLLNLNKVARDIPSTPAVQLVP